MRAFSLRCRMINDGISIVNVLLSLIFFAFRSPSPSHATIAAELRIWRTCSRGRLTNRYETSPHSDQLRALISGADPPRQGRADTRRSPWPSRVRDSVRMFVHSRQQSGAFPSRWNGVNQLASIVYRPSAVRLMLFLAAESCHRLH